MVIFETSILKIIRRSSRSPHNAEIGYFTLLFYRGRQRNVSRNTAIVLGRVVRKPVTANPGLNLNQSINFSCRLKMFFTAYVLGSLYSNSKLKDKQYKQENSPNSCKFEIKILANPGLA